MIRAFLSLLLVWSVAAPVQPPAPAAPAATAVGPVWRIERDGVVGFLVGSVHVLSPSYYPLPAPVLRAFEASTTVIGELHPDDLASGAATRMLQRGLFTDGNSLERSLPAESWTALRDRFRRAGLPSTVIDQMKPWMAMLTLVTLQVQREGFQPELGVDRHLLDRAAAQGKRVEGLETLDQQIDRLDGLSPSLQNDLVTETLRDLDTQSQHVTALADAWTQGDVATLEPLLVGELRKMPELYSRLIVERNRAWLPRLEACFAAHPPCLVVVGTAHVLGSDSVGAMLEARGYTVTREGGRD